MMRDAFVNPGEHIRLGGRVGAALAGEAFACRFHCRLFAVVYAALQPRLSTVLHLSESIVIEASQSRVSTFVPDDSNPEGCSAQLHRKGC